MHHTIDKIPKAMKKISLEKNHKENKTGTNDSFKPIKLKKYDNKKYETWK